MGLHKIFLRCDELSAGRFSTGAKVCAAGSVTLPYQKYADDAALYTEVTLSSDGPDECIDRTALRTELENRTKWPLHRLKARASNLKILPEGKRSARAPWVEMLVNHECPHLRLSECDGEDQG